MFIGSSPNDEIVGFYVSVKKILGMNKFTPLNLALEILNYHLISNHEDRLQSEFPFALSKQIFQ